MTSPVWNFRARFSDVFGEETSGGVPNWFPGWWRRCSTCIYIQRILSRFLDNKIRRSGSFVKSPGWFSCHLITKLILAAFKLRCQDLDKAIAESREMERITFLSLSIWIQILPKKRSTRFTHSNDVTWQPPWSCFYF